MFVRRCRVCRREIDRNEFIATGTDKCKKCSREKNEKE